MQNSDSIQCHTSIVLNNILHELHACHSIDKALQHVCGMLVDAFSQPQLVECRVWYDKVAYSTPNFNSQSATLTQTFSITEKLKGGVDLFYCVSKDQSAPKFTLDEYTFVNDLCQLLEGFVSTSEVKRFSLTNEIQTKSQKVMGLVDDIFKTNRNLDEALDQICGILPTAMRYPASAAVRITYGGKVHSNCQFADTVWHLQQPFVADKQQGLLDVYYLQEFPVADNGPFLIQEQQLLEGLAGMLTSAAIRDSYSRLKYQNNEREKELMAIKRTTQIVQSLRTKAETLQDVCNILPLSWQFPDYTAARIQFENQDYATDNFRVTEWGQKTQFVTVDNKKGVVEVYYLKQFPEADEGPFLSTERDMLASITQLITGYLNSYKSTKIIQQKAVASSQKHETENLRKSLSKQTKPLQQYFNQQMIEKYMYLDMMKFKIKHVLFVSTLYDAFLLENDDSFFERFMGEVYQYGLFALPRITGVSSKEDAIEIMNATPIDLVIIMVGVDRELPMEIGQDIKALNPSVPVYLLVNKQEDVRYFNDIITTTLSFDKLFVWNGDASVIFAMVKSIEDGVNVDNDTKVGLVRVILLIEDSPNYYSRYLQILYSIVFDQLQILLPEVEKNELNKIAKIRSRPKILHARNYEEAIAVFNRYKDFLLCVVSDVEFDWGGRLDKEAGIKFVNYMRSQVFSVPVILQSSENVDIPNAEENKIFFINKNSETLFEDLRKYLIRYLGYGDFLFRTGDGRNIGVARSLREFETLLREVPDDSFYRHAIKNQYSIWLMGRGEIQLARTINQMRLDESNNVAQARQEILDAIQTYKEEKKKGKILNYDETSTIDEHNIVSFAGGTIGGKARGLAFIDVLIYNLNLGEIGKRINLLSPITVVIGTDEFDNFIATNHLFEKVVNSNTPYEEIRKLFFNGKLSDTLVAKVREFANHINTPIAVRSSSISEDSVNQPFAGVFDTYLVPNQKDDKEKVVKNLCDAIKLVFASVYSDQARGYFKAINRQIEGEKMAVIIQELVGSQFGNYYYPHISGVAQSHNFYPVADMKPEEGFAVAAMGLGSYVVDGWKSYRFSPRYPKVSMYTTKSLLHNTQTQFYALDTTMQDVDFLEHGELAAVKLLDTYEAEKHGSMKHLASVYDANNDSIYPGLDKPGARIINFANILQYNYIPLAETIDLILNAVKEAFGSPVEIEYAVNLNRGLNGLPSFYLLQIKPLVGADRSKFNPKLLENKDDMFLYTKLCLGNGVIDDIEDVVYIDNDKFSKMETVEMAKEIDTINNIMISEKRKYILIGPGRWGTSDRFLGVPVDWSQISNARVIVEESLDNYPLDFSLGSHFFHNVTSMNIGYFAVQSYSKQNFIRWEVLEKQELVRQTAHFRHVRFKQPIKVIMDGTNKESAIFYKNF
ncbi:MAG: pyruvate, phosphate dikinase [Salinivirgaceae bacterium]|nr:pyruvate, phosphate dikinase [Salinivirgaceae bacterium]